MWDFLKKYRNDFFVSLLCLVSSWWVTIMIAPQTMEIAQQQWEIPLPFTEIKYPLDNRVTIITFSTSLLYLILIFFAYMVKTWKFELKKETDVSTEAIKSIQSFVSSKDKSLAIPLNLNRVDFDVINHTTKVLIDCKISNKKKLYASDLGSPFDWVKADVLAYDTLQKIWLKTDNSSGQKQLERILIWHEDDYDTSLALDIINVQNISGYKIRFLSYEFLIDKAGDLVSKLLNGRNKYDFEKPRLNFVLWDIKEINPVAATHPYDSEGTTCFGFGGIVSSDGKIMVNYFNESEFSYYKNLWNVLDLLASPPLENITSSLKTPKVKVGSPIPENTQTELKNTYFNKISFNLDDAFTKENKSNRLDWLKDEISGFIKSTIQ